jgi:GGDEF domain-containing protein
MTVVKRIQEALLQQKGFNDEITATLGHAVHIPPEHWLNCSIGICEFMPFEDTNIKPNDILIKADLAMYTAKNLGKGGCVIWSPDLKKSETLEK